MKRVLQIDGGDIRGIIPAIICSAIEEKTKKAIADIFDLIIGTSTGSVIGGALAAGVSAERVKQVYINDLIPGFDSRKKVWKPWTWFRPCFDRESFMKMMRQIIGSQNMGDLKTEFISTAYNRCSQRTHFISSADPKDKDKSVVDVISWSALSAAWFFGAICEPEYRWDELSPDGEIISRKGAVFQDGGQGLNNNTVAATLIESLTHDWDSKGGISILSLGTGSEEMYSPYKKEAKQRYLREVLEFPFQARRESSALQVGAGYKVAANRPEVFFSRIDTKLSKKQTKFGDTDNIPLLKKLGLELAERVPYKELGLHSLEESEVFVY